MCQPGDLVFTSWINFVSTKRMTSWNSWAGSPNTSWVPKKRVRVSACKWAYVFHKTGGDEDPAWTCPCRDRFNSCETIQQSQTCTFSRGPLFQHQSMANKATAVWRGCLHRFIVSLTSRSVIMMKLLIPSVYEKLFAIRVPHIRVLISHDSSGFWYILLYTCGSFWFVSGVQSFAGFVAQSDRMLLLWSPEYFTRLWCTLATRQHVVEGFREAPLASKATWGSKRLWNKYSIIFVTIWYCNPFFYTLL